MQAVIDVLRSDWLTQGPTLERFEHALAAACGARHAVAVSSGTAALHIACLAAGLGPGDVSVTSPITFLATANAVAYCGAQPAFSDVDEETITLDVARLAETCDRLKPKAILPVDFAGQPAALPAVYDIARACGALVIEDAAHSLGAEYEFEGQRYRAASCAHADMAILSFHPVKHITTGEGGAVTTNDDALYGRLLQLRNHGRTKDAALLTAHHGPWYYEQHRLGFNYRITDLQCALGLSQLPRLPRFIERRRQIIELYRTQLARHCPEVRLLTEQAGRRSSYHLAVVLVPAGLRRLVFDELCTRGVVPQVHYIPVHLQPWYGRNYGYKPGDFPVAEAYYERCLSLPLYPDLADDDVAYVVQSLREALDCAL